jgi:uncharacterized protein YkwD
MVRAVSIFFLLFFSTISFAQFSSKDTIDAHKFNNRLVESLLLEKINAYRTSKGIARLQYNPTIHKVAKDHCIYLKNKKLSHTQTTPGKQEIHDRLKYYTSARSFSVSENIARTYVLVPTYNILSNGQTVESTAYTYEQAAEYMFNAWKNSATHNANILTGKYNLSGISVYLNPKDKTLTAVQVFALIRS